MRRKVDAYQFFLFVQAFQVAPAFGLRYFRFGNGNKAIVPKEGIDRVCFVHLVFIPITDKDVQECFSFAIIDKDGKKIGYARSVWAMISLKTRKPADLLALHGGSIVDYVCDEPCPIEKPSRIKVTSAEPASSLNAKYSDIDINGHVNSIRYIEHILDLFPIELYKESRIRRFEMAYVAESYYGDELTFYKDYVGNGTYDIEVRKNGGEAVCRSKVIFVEK